MQVSKQDLWVHPGAMWIPPAAGFATNGFCAARQQCPTCMWHMPAIESWPGLLVTLHQRSLYQLHSMRSLATDCHRWWLWSSIFDKQEAPAGHGASMEHMCLLLACSVRVVVPV